ncbi:unnamed protein product [Effrenium voratum]|nr:unnamed protein product [Effrenium voratum]
MFVCVCVCACVCFNCGRMQPWLVTAVLAVLMCFTSTTYFFQIPEELRKKEVSQIGRWGPPDAEFNWCESDYELLDWVAEPVNTMSCLVMMMLPMIFLAMHQATHDVVVIAWMEVAIAIGSILFHASLRYPMQLADEIPMLWYVAATASSCLRRVRGMECQSFAYAWVAVVTCVILATSQHSLLHQIFRGLMTCTFSSFLVVIGWGASAMAARIRDKRGAGDRVLQAALLMFAVSVVAWLLDNHHCSWLQNLPFGLPYPQLHTWWHIFIAGTLHCLRILLHMDSHRHSDKLELRWMAGFPAVCA